MSKKTTSDSLDRVAAFVAGPCDHCEGTGVDNFRWIRKAALPLVFGVTPRRVRQLVEEGVIDPPVPGHGYPGTVIAQFLNWKFPQRHEHEMRELVKMRRAEYLRRKLE
jgi:hypothetical protein